MIIRSISSSIIDALRYFRIIYIDGARQVGKTTLVKQIATSNNYNYVTLDNNDSLILAKKNASMFFSINKPPLIIDEVQKAPEIINYIKMLVDNSPEKKGQFILTGSVDFIKSVNINESLAGRLVGYKLYPLSNSELNKQQFNWLDVLFKENFHEYFNNNKDHSYDFLLNRLLTGGFPEIQLIDAKRQNQWFTNYIQARINKDIKDLTKYNLQKADKLPSLLKLLADQSADLLNISNIAKKLSLNFDTVEGYIFLIESMFLIEKLNPYETNVGRQVKKMKKVYFTDTGLIKNLSKITYKKLIEDRQLFGKLLENYIFNEIKKQMTFSNDEYDIYYYRDHKTYEVDFIIENNEGDVICIEVKSAQKIDTSDLKGLRSFKRNYGKKITAMYVFYGGDSISALSIDESPVYLLPYNQIF